jgi:flagellar biosynthesis protein FliR
MHFPMESLEQVQGFFWIFIRVGILFLMLPLFSARGIPAMWKIGFSFLLSLVLTPVVPPPPSFPQNALQVILGVSSEALLGFLMAMVVRLLFASIELGGQFMGFQMGFNMASAMDPQTGGQSEVISQFLYIFTILVFFIVNGHHLFIHALAASFKVVPPNTFQVNGLLFEWVIKTSGEMFLIGLKLAAPIMIALFLSNLCLGIVARTVPQVNILMIGFPVNIGLGLILFGVLLSNLSPFLVELTRKIGEALMRMIQLM